MDDDGGLRRKDTTKGPPLRILSLDGGGVRGYSIFIILQELMHRTFVEMEGRAPKRHEIPRPCDHFDLIAGTGTGGLIAIMLGRLRLDIDTCKDVYVRMTRKVFETDKTFAGIPYKGTLFKASKLEEAIKECVKEHTVFDDEGNDTLANAVPMSPSSPVSSNIPQIPARSVSNASRYSQVGMSAAHPRTSASAYRFGNPNALLYDTRETRTKTAVTAAYKGSSMRSPSVFLRSYDSRKETAPDVNCTIWQAGRATSAIGLAFKPIQVGQSVYHDDGNGKYNPAEQVLDEAILNEWPGREVGVFISVGTGKRPSGTGNRQAEWWEGFVGGGLGDFAEARRRLIEKIEGCEDTHQHMLASYLAKRGVRQENYFRLNVEVGVGEFGMNEWNRLSDVSTRTRQYLADRECERVVHEAAAKFAKIHFAKRRQDRQSSAASIQSAEERWDRPPESLPSPRTFAVELPAGDVPAYTQQPSRGPPSAPAPYRHSPSIADMRYTITSSDEYPQPLHITKHDSQQRRHTPPQQQQQQQLPYRPSLDSPRRSNGSIPATGVATQSPQDAQPSSPRHHQHYHAQDRQHYPAPARDSPPPLPPKTPLPYPEQNNPQTQIPPRQASNPVRMSHPPPAGYGAGLPYPDTDAPPPVVNMARKPEFSAR